MNSPLTILVIVFYFTLMCSAIFVSSILNLWVVIELRMFLFISLSFLSIIKENLTSEGLLSYYLTQSGLSIALLFLILLGGRALELLGVLVLFSKLGVAPMNLWFYSVFIKRGVLPLYYMMTLQKFPVLLFVNLMEWSYLENTCFLILNLIICGCMALISRDLKSLLIRSSLSNNSWLVVSLISRVELFFGFFLIYSFTLYWVLNSKLSDLILLRLSGLPPFPLFFLKLGVVYLYFSAQGSEFFVVMSCVFILSALILSSSYVRYYTRLIIKVISSSVTS